MPSEKGRNLNKTDKSAVKSLEDKLYQAGSEGVKIRGRSYLKPEKTNVSTGWDAKQNEPMKTKKRKTLSRFSIPQKIFLLSFLVFLFSAGFAFMTFYQNKNTISSQNIAVEFDHVAFVDGGEELQVSVDITNRNNAPLQFTNMTLEYPSVTALNGNGVARETFALDTIRPGETKTAEFSVVMYGEQGLQNNMRGVFQYRVDGSNATFEKESTSLVTLRSTPVDIVLTSRDQIIGSQEEKYEFLIISQSEEPLPNLLFQLDLPPGFDVSSVEPISLFGDETWLLGTLDPLEEKKITVTGSIHGDEGQVKTIRAYVGAGGAEVSKGIVTVFNSLNKTVELIKPFLKAELYIGRSTSETISIAAGQKISGAIAWENTLDEAIKSAEIILNLGGGAYDKSAVEPQSGFFNSSENKIIWSKSSSESLSVVEPGESGTLRFTLTPKSLNGSRFSSPEVVLKVGVKGVDSSGQLREASQTDTLRVQIGTVINVLAESLHNSGPFNNAGPLPPKVGKSTEYTIKWTVTNSSNIVEGTRVTATLPSYVEWKEQTSPSSENIRYEPNSRTVVWDLNDLAPNSGFGGSSSRTAYFQVAVLPSSSQIGETVDLTSRVEMTGTDTYTRERLSENERAATTRLLNDGTNDVSAAGGRVSE